MWRPRRTISPSRPTTMPVDSTGGGSGTGSDSTEISSATSGSSSGATGGKRGSSCAAATVISRTTAPRSRSAAMWPIHPRTAPRSEIVPTAPRFNPAPATAGTGGSGRPARWASSVPRASSSNAALSAAVSSGSAMVRLSAADRVGPVQLLVQEDARQLVRQRQQGKAPHPLRAPERRPRQPVGAADGERHVPGIQLPARRPLGELLRRPLVPGPRQRHEARPLGDGLRSEEHTSELQSPCNLVCRLLLEKKKNTRNYHAHVLHTHGRR